MPCAWGSRPNRSTLSDSQRESVEYILIAGRHLLAMINEVLDLARIEAGGLMLAIEPFGLADLLSESLDLIRPALLGNPAWEQFSILLARVSLGIFFAISGGNKLLVPSRTRQMYETLTGAGILALGD